MSDSEPGESSVPSALPALPNRPAATRPSDPPDRTADPQPAPRASSVAGQLPCPIHGMVPMAELRVHEIRAFNADGSRANDLYHDVTGTEPAEAVLRGLSEGKRNRRFVVRHESCGSVVGRNYTIVLAGMTAAGKTHLLLGLVYMVTKSKAGSRLTVTTKGVDTRASLEGDAITVFEERRLVRETIYTTLEDQQPHELTFQAIIDGGLFSRQVTMHDVAGEVVDGTVLMDEILAFAGSTDYIIFCLDPTTLPGLATDHEEAPRGQGWLENMISGFADMVRDFRDVSDGGDGFLQKAPVAAAVVLTKADVLLTSADAEWSRIFDNQLQVFGEDATFDSWQQWADAIQDQSELVKDFLHSLGTSGQGLVRYLEASFESVSFHVASPLGSRPEFVEPADGEDTDTDNRQQTYTKTPYRLAGVVEPFARGFWRRAGYDPMEELNGDPPW